MRTNPPFSAIWTNLIIFTLVARFIAVRRASSSEYRKSWLPSWAQRRHCHGMGHLMPLTAQYTTNRKHPNYYLIAQQPIVLVGWICCFAGWFISHEANRFCESRARLGESTLTLQLDPSLIPSLLHRELGYTKLSIRLADLCCTFILFSVDHPCVSSGLGKPLQSVIGN